MSYIENCSLDDFVKGNHRVSPKGAIAIQIIDPGDETPSPKEDVFDKRYVFEFLDAEEVSRFTPHNYLISDEQSSQIASILLDALCQGKDVIVHCVAGMCRSGAVVEVAEMIGFNKCPRHRHPNVLVKRKLMEQFKLLPQ